MEQLAWNRAAPHQLASASLDETVRLWDCHTGKCLETLHCRGELIGVAWSADGRYIAVGSKTNIISLIGVQKERSRVLCFVQWTTEVNELHFAQRPDSHLNLLALSTGKGTVELVDVPRLRDQALTATTAAAAAASTATTTSSSSASSSSSSRSSIPLLAPPPSVCVLDNHTAPVYCLEISHDGRLIASGGADATVCVRETTQLTPVAVLARTDGAVRALSFGSYPVEAGAGRRELTLLAVGSEEGLVEVSVVGLQHAAGNARVWSSVSEAETNSVTLHPTLPLLAYATDSKERCLVHLFGVQ